MRHLTRLLVPALALFALAAAPLRAADTVELKPRWTPGKQYFQTMQMVQATNMTIGAQKVDQKMNMTMELSLAVRAHEDGARKRVTLKYERVAMSMEMNGQKMGYDSAKPDAEAGNAFAAALSQSFGKVVGQEFKLILTPKGELAEIENLDALLKGLPAAALPGMDMRQMFNKEAMAETMKQGGLASFPGRPVKVGDSWPIDTTMPVAGVGVASQKGTCTLKALAPRAGVPCAEVVIASQIALDAKPNAGAPAGAMAQLGVKIEGGRQDGTVWFDPQIGMAREVQLHQEMTLSMKNPADPNATMKIPMQQDITATLTKVVDLK